MMTSTHIAQAKSAFRPFITNCAAYRALLTEHNLPLSVDLIELTDTLRDQLFSQLLDVDAGLKMRYDLLRTDEAQRQLITSTINLDGYPVVTQLKQQLAQLEQGFNSLNFYQGPYWVSMKMLGHTLAGLCEGYGLDIEQWLESERIDWTGHVMILAYFTDLAVKLTELRELKRLIGQNSAGLMATVGGDLASYFTKESEDGLIAPDEYRLMHNLIPALEKADKLANFPASLK